jgi:hypothetical protein
MSALTVVGSRKEAAERDFTVANLSCPVEVMRFNLVYRGAACVSHRYCIRGPDYA